MRKIFNIIIILVLIDQLESSISIKYMRFVDTSMLFIVVLAFFLGNLKSAAAKAISTFILVMTALMFILIP